MVLGAKHISKSFVGVRALSDANFALRSGEVCGLVGANGSGKTTFARIVSGLLTPDGGELQLYEKPVNLRSHLDAESFRMAMVHQNLSLVPEMTIWENIALGRERQVPLPSWTTAAPSRRRRKRWRRFPRRSRFTSA